MTNTEARKLARADIRGSLQTAGLVEGITLSDNELKKETKTCFWHGVLRNEKAKDKDCYVTYFIPASPVTKRADDSVFLREVTIAVDLFSKRSFDSQENHQLLEALEDQFTNDGYEVELAEELFESDTGLFHYPITLYKLY